MKLTYSLLLGAAAVLSGCSEPESTVDASDGAAFQDSVSQIKAELTGSERAAFGDALFTLSFPQSGGADAIGAAEKFSALARNPDALVARLGPKLDGMTADEVIAAARDYKLNSLDSELGRLNTEVEKWAGYANSATTILSAFTIRSPRYYWRQNDMVDRAVIDFEIVNNSPIAVKRIVLLGNLQSPGREIPWANGTFSYTFPGGLEPGESQRLKLMAGAFGAWSQEKLRDMDEAELSLSLINVRDAHDTPLVPPEVERLDEMRQQIAALTAERDALTSAQW